MFFGKKLREIRLKQGIGLSQFAKVIGMKPSLYSSMEHGHVPPPKDKEWFCEICNFLNLQKGSEDIKDLEIEWKKPFVIQLMPDDFCPVFASTCDGHTPSEGIVSKIIKDYKDMAKKHNDFIQKDDKESSGG